MAPRKGKKELTDDERLAVYHELLVKASDMEVPRSLIKDIAVKYDEGRKNYSAHLEPLVLLKSYEASTNTVARPVVVVLMSQRSKQPSIMLPLVLATVFDTAKLQASLSLRYMIF